MLNLLKQESYGINLDEQVSFYMLRRLQVMDQKKIEESNLELQLLTYPSCT